jgi:hypothetical protein
MSIAATITISSTPRHATIVRTSSTIRSGELAEQVPRVALGHPQREVVGRHLALRRAPPVSQSYTPPPRMEDRLTGPSGAVHEVHGTNVAVVMFISQQPWPGTLYWAVSCFNYGDDDVLNRQRYATRLIPGSPISIAWGVAAGTGPDGSSRAPTAAARGTPPRRRQTCSPARHLTRTTAARRAVT